MQLIHLWVVLVSSAILREDRLIVSVLCTLGPATKKDRNPNPHSCRATGHIYHPTRWRVMTNNTIVEACTVAFEQYHQTSLLPSKHPIMCQRTFDGKQNTCIIRDARWCPELDVFC
jgi:hypothetical protein